MLHCISNYIPCMQQAQTVVAVVGGSADSVWLTSTIAILTVVLSPVMSQAADYWGRRWVLILLTLCGVVGSIVVSRANSIGMAIAGFTITGIAYGAQPLLHAVASEVLPRRYRPWAQGATNLSAALGGVVGLLAGGAMTRNGNAEGFRNYWYLATAVFAVATLLTATLYTPPKTDKEINFTTREKLAKLDWIGYALLSSSLVLFCMGLSWSQNPYPWSDPHTSATFAIGLALLIALVAYETWAKTDGMIHHDLFIHRNFAIALGCVFVEGLVFFAANNYFAFEVSILYETDTLRTGLRYTVNMLVYGAASVFAGFYCSKTKNVRWPASAAFVSMVIFFVLMATATPSATSSRNVWGYPVFLGMGLGTCLCALVTVAQLSTPRELIAITSGLMLGMRSLGGSVGLAICESLFFRVLLFFKIFFYFFLAIHICLHTTMRNTTYTNYSDNAILSGHLNTHLGANIAAAVLPLGLPETSLGDLITALADQDNAALAGVPGISNEIIGAAVGALKSTYSVAFRWVWVSAGSFTIVAAVGKCTPLHPELFDRLNADLVSRHLPGRPEERVQQPH